MVWNRVHHVQFRFMALPTPLASTHNKSLEFFFHRMCVFVGETAHKTVPQILPGDLPGERTTVHWERGVCMGILCVAETYLSNLERILGIWGYKYESSSSHTKRGLCCGEVLCGVGSRCE